MPCSLCCRKAAQCAVQRKSGVFPAFFMPENMPKSGIKGTKKPTAVTQSVDAGKLADQFFWTVTKNSTMALISLSGNMPSQVGMPKSGRPLVMVVYATLFHSSL